MRQQRLSSIQISARAPSGCDQSPLVRSAAHQSATIRAPHHNAPQMCNQKIRERAHFSFHHHQRPSSHHSGGNFTTGYFYRLPSVIPRVLLEKRMHWHRSQAIGCWCLCRLCLNQSFKGKTAFNGSCARRYAVTEPSNRAAEQTHRAERHLVKSQPCSDRGFRFQSFPQHPKCGEESRPTLPLRERKTCLLHVITLLHLTRAARAAAEWLRSSTLERASRERSFCTTAFP